MTTPPRSAPRVPAVLLDNHGTLVFHRAPELAILVGPRLSLRLQDRLSEEVRRLSASGWDRARPAASSASHS